MKIHFIGIGGIGVSALAQYYLRKGCKVTGSDLVSSEITDYLKKSGAEVSIGQDKELSVKDMPDLVIYSPAVKSGNSELDYFNKKGVKCLSYPEALGQLTKEYFTIAVSGTHGKSTTTAMVSLILTEAGFDPTVIIGTKLKEFNNTNFRFGKSRYLVIEADEWNASFLNYWPKIIVLTNIEKEHMDYYKDIRHILKTYKEYIAHLDKDGILVLNKDDRNINKIKDKGIKKIEFSIFHKEANTLKDILKIPGEHNISNALAALSVSRALKIDDRTALKALSKYQGSWRRFEVKKGRIIVVSDYGHHPTEVSATLKAARERYRDKKIFCVFQPHQHQRTYYLFNEFVKIFRLADIDRIIITDIYDVAGRETKAINKKVSSELLVKKIKKDNIIYMEKEKVEDYLKDRIKEIDVLIVMGAGDIYKLADGF
ncbi:MAG: Mur ligase domain-containing protein [Candidatus Pacebacteria bacterium]|nr:Mur ligase domain-containing protein [Candidatus Paceibacterota bacterium]